MEQPEDPPSILPFPGIDETAGPEPEPEPVLDFHAYFIKDGVPIHLVGQRWRREDAEHSPTPTFPDPMDPGILLTSFIEDQQGLVIPAVSYEAYQAYLQATRPESGVQPAVTVSG